MLHNVFVGSTWARNSNMVCLRTGYKRQFSSVYSTQFHHIYVLIRSRSNRTLNSVCLVFVSLHITLELPDCLAFCTSQLPAVRLFANFFYFHNIQSSYFQFSDSQRLKVFITSQRLSLQTKSELWSVLSIMPRKDATNTIKRIKIKPLVLYALSIFVRVRNKYNK